MESMMLGNIVDSNVCGHPSNCSVLKTEAQRWVLGVERDLRHRIHVVDTCLNQ
jgi:hypothetical protein